MPSAFTEEDIRVLQTMADQLASAIDNAILFEAPGKIAVKELALAEPATEICTVDVAWSGISTGTERLLYSMAVCRNSP
ncbi:MAG: hypothetical protein HC806_06035, partial [Anaerolineae bacterium]|nr:hypothetical protein [Anaerolineae bacterium]